MGQFDDIFGVKTPDDSGVAVSGEYDDIFGIKPQRTLKTNLQDVAATAAKGITGLSDAAIGLANIPTMGQAGRAAQLVGLNEVYDDPMQAEQALQEHQQNVAAGKRNEFLDSSPYSAPQQFAQKQVTDAEGVLGKLGAAVRNPSTIATAVGESVPSMLAGGMIGRGLAVGTKLSPVVGGAIGEGVVGAGAAAEQTRKESPTGTLTPRQTAMAVGSGVGTGIFGYVGGKVANKLGFDDADTLIANGFQRVAKKSAAGGTEVAEKGFAQNAAEVAGRIVAGGVSEGAFEELPQSIQETMWQNAATGKPLTEGMDEAAVMGFLSGVAMGGPVNALPRPTQTSPEQTQTAPAPGPISRAADMLARTTPGIMGKVMDPALAPLPEDNLSGEWNAQTQQALAGNQARNFTQAEQAAYDLEQQRQAQQAEARRKADPLAAQKAAFEESYNAMGTVPESIGNISPDDAAAFERKVEFERATNRRQQYIKAWKQAEQEADTLTRDPEIPAAVKREARKQVREIVKADPVYEQMNEVKRRGGLNLEAMGQDYDRDTVNIINRRYPGIFSRVGSVKPDDFANEMGYDDLDAMVRRFSEARTQKELTASILKEKTGAWQNAESEQQSYAAKQAERKQGAEWAGAQGADSVSRGIPTRTVFPAPDEAVSAMESMIRRKPENFKEEDFDHWTYTAEQQGRLKQAYREAVNGENSEAGKGNSSVKESGAAETGRNITNPNRDVSRENQTPSSQPSTPVVETDIQPGEEVSRAGLDVPNEVAATEPIRRQPGESTRDFIKRRKAGKEVAAGESFDVGHASEAAYNQPQNAAIRDAWTRANIVQDSDGTARRMQHDHFDEWHAGGGVSAGIGSQYDAHGIAKSNPLGALLNLLQNGIDTTRRFDTAPLVTNSGTSAGLGAASGAYKDGPFIILGKKGKELKEGIHTVLVSDAVSGVIPQLQQRFPGVRFVKYSEAQATLENDSANVSPNQKNEPQADLSPTGETQTRTDSLTNRIANVADQQSNQDVIVDKTSDKTADKSAVKKSADSEFANNKVFTADIRAEVAAKLGRFRSMQLMRRGVLNVVATQDEAESRIDSKDEVFRSEDTGAIQGYVKKGKLYLVADGIPPGNAYQVFLHEITHLTRLGLNSNTNFKRLLNTIESHKGQDTALGKAIAAAEARIPADTKPEHRTEEILAYLIENDRTDVGVVRRFIAMVKRVLVNMGVSPDIFSKEDFKALAVNAAKWQSTMATGDNVMRSVREMFKPVDPNSPALKRWQGNSQITDPVFHGSPKEFWTFDKNRVGKNTTSPRAGLGFFFATNRAESQGYAGPSGSLRSFYVKAENPKYMNASDLPRFRGVDEAQAYAKRQQLAGYDSIVLEDEGHVIVFEPNQVKSAEINTGAFDAGNDDVRHSVAGGGTGITGNGSGPVWATPQDSKTDSFIYNAQDKLIDMKRIQDNIEKVLGPIQEQHDVRMAEELYHKRAAKRVEDVLVAEVNPLMKELGAIPSADLSEFEEYMHALHAPEANESLRQRNPNEQELRALKEAAKEDRDNLQQSAIVRRFIDKERELAAAERDVEAGDADDSLIAVINDELESLRDEPIVGKYIKAREKHRKIRHAQPFGGDNTALSGMSNEAAESLLANMPAAKLSKYKALAAKWRRFMDKTRDTLVQYELESQETVDSWGEAFENYVPLHREDMENGMGIGQGFSVKGSATRSRTGSNRKVVDIIAHIVAQRERAIVRGEKAAISRALYGLAAANPNPDVWTIETPPVVREFDPVTGLVVSRPDPMYKNKPNAVVHRFIDEKGHVEERAVLFNEQSERGMRLAQALKNLDTEQLGAILRTSAVLTRWFSAINTQYNLVFGPVNAIRDAGSAMLHLTDTPLAGRQTQVAKRIATGIKPLFKAIWAEASGTPLDTDIAKAWHELQIEGGTTGFRDMFENAEERAEELKRAMLSTTKSRIAAKLSWAKQQVSQYNDVMENCTRLAVYMESRDQGLSKAKSASLAKNITLNFNRKGKVASQAGAMYAFFNASMQGTEKMYRTMTGPAGKKILAGGLLLGASQAVLLAAAGFGDDEPPEFIKERALIIPVGGKKYVTIPMPLGFNIIPNVARVATEWMLSGGKDTGERVTGLIGSFAETFNPIGNAGFSVQTIAPTVIDPLVALSENKDWTGKPIAKQNFNTLKPTPGHERMKDTASAVGIGLSRLLNFLSGGTEYTPGSLSPTPDQIDYLIGQAFGGVGRESLKAAQVVGTMYTGEDLPVYKIPLVSRFYGDSADSSAASTAFYRNVKRMNVHAAEIEGLTENRGDVAGYMADHPEAKYVRRTEATYRRVQKLQKVKRTLLNNDAPREKVEAVEKSISSRMSSYNNYVKER